MSKVSREALYQKVWERPMTSVAADYDVSSNFLGRICEELNVPRPARGYWAKKRAGKTVKKESLPPPEPGDDSFWVQGRGTQGEEDVTYRPPNGTRLREKTKRHPALAGARVGFLKSEPRRFSDDGYLKPKARLLPDLLVSEGVLSRALKFAHNFFAALEDAGYWVRIAAPGFSGRIGSVNPRVDESGAKDESRWRPREFWQPTRPTLVYVGGVPIGITLFERLETMPAIHENDGFRPATRKEISMYNRAGQGWRVSQQDVQNGQLGLRAYSPFEETAWERYWLEQDGKRLEDRVPEIVEALGSAAPNVAELERERREERAREQVRLEQARRERWQAAREKAELDSVAASQEQLLALIDDWTTSRRIEDFLSSLKRELETLPPKEREGLHERIASVESHLAVPRAADYLKSWESPREHFQRIWSEREPHMW